LQGLSPRGLSADTRQEITSQLNDADLTPDASLVTSLRTTQQPKRRPVMLTVAAVAVALSTLIWVGWLTWNDVDPKNNIVEVEPDVGIEEDIESQVVWDGIGDQTVPNLWAYRKAAAGSFDDIDKLLSDHSGSEMGGGSQYALADIR
jgi:hypothetical protein